MKLNSFILTGLAALTIGCSSPSVKSDVNLTGKAIYDNPRALLMDKTLPVEKNKDLAESLKALYSKNSCVGIGYDESKEVASNKASTEFYANGCSNKAPEKIINFRAYNGTFFTIFSNNRLCYNIRLEDNK